MSKPLETLFIPCARCGEPVKTEWVHNGGMLPGDGIELIADCIFHKECWDRVVEECPP